MIWPMKGYLKCVLVVTFVLQGAEICHAQSDDLIEGMTSPSLGFLPRKVREQMIYEVPYRVGESAQSTWRVAQDKRDFQREGATNLTLSAAELYELRVGGLGNVKTRTYDDVDSEWIDLKSYGQWNSLLSDHFGSQTRLRLRWEFPAPEEGGVVFYYRHRERYAGREQERTKWARANDLPEGNNIPFIDEHELRHSPERQVMDELGFNVTWWPTPRTHLDFSAVYRKGEDHLIEQRREYDSRSGTIGLPGSRVRRGYVYDEDTDVIEAGVVTEATSLADRSRVERQLKDETEEKQRYGWTGAIQHELGERSWLRFDSELAFKENREPDRQDTEYAEQDTAVFHYTLDGNRPIFRLDPLPWDVFGLRKVEFENNLKREWYQQHRLSWHHEVERGHELEGGGFFQRRRDFRDVNYQRFEPRDSPAMSGFDSEIRGMGSTSANGISIGPDIDPGLARGLNFSQLVEQEAEGIYKTAREDYDTKRDVMGAWAQYRWEPSEAWRFHAGARLEYSRGVYRAKQAYWNGSENFGNVIFPANPVATEETEKRRKHSDILPSLLLEYQPEENSYWAFQAKQLLQRSRLWELAPRLAVDEDRGTAPSVLSGNTNLEPSRQTQVSLIRDHAFAAGSFLRLSAEYWDLDDPMTRASWFQPYEIPHPDVTNTGLRNYRFEQTISGKSGSLIRFGSYYAQQLSFLPHPFDQMGVFGSYTLTSSEQNVEVGGNSRQTDLSFQPDHRALLGIFFRGPSWHGRVFTNFHSDYLVSMGEARMSTGGAGDHFVDSRITLDAAFEYRFSDHWEFYVEGANLLNTPLRIYEESERRQTHWERHGAAIRIGFHAFF